MSVLACGVIKLGKSKMDHPEKLKIIFQRISGLIKEFKPTELAIEAPFYGKNVQSMLKLGRAQGVAMAAGLMHDLTIHEYAPRKVKVAVTGNGAASKEQIAKMLEHLLKYKIDSKHFDASDGLAVAVCHFFQGNKITKGNNYRDWSSFIQNNPDRIK